MTVIMYKKKFFAVWQQAPSGEDGEFQDFSLVTFFIRNFSKFLLADAFLSTAVSFVFGELFIKKRCIFYWHRPDVD